MNTLNTLNTPDATLQVGRHRGRLVSAVARTDGSWLLWLASVPKFRHDSRLRAALAAHLPAALESAARADQARLDRLEAEATARRQRWAALKARHASEKALKAAQNDPEAIA
ncbi:MAG: hypothetical protein JNJ71_10845 [Rubrivivax sp.]|nr:hypothetical protein [Rubrivivax sp.]